MNIRTIMRVVGDFYGVTRAQLQSSRRLKYQVRPRHIAMYLCRVLVKGSYPEIAHHFNCDHTTVMHAVKKIERERLVDLRLFADIDALHAAVAALPTDEPKPVVAPCPTCGRCYLDPERRKELVADLRDQMTQISGKVDALEKIN